MCQSVGTEGKENILVEISITKSSGEKLYTKKKILHAVANHVDMDIHFDWLFTGEYDLTLDVTDLISGKKAFEYIKFIVK